MVLSYYANAKGRDRDKRVRACPWERGTSRRDNRNQLSAPCEKSARDIPAIYAFFRIPFGFRSLKFARALASARYHGDSPREFHREFRRARQKSAEPVRATDCHMYHSRRRPPPFGRLRETSVSLSRVAFLPSYSFQVSHLHPRRAATPFPFIIEGAYMHTRAQEKSFQRSRLIRSFMIRATRILPRNDCTYVGTTETFPDHFYRSNYESLRVVCSPRSNFNWGYTCIPIVSSMLSCGLRVQILIVLGDLEWWNKSINISTFRNAFFHMVHVFVLPIFLGKRSSGRSVINVMETTLTLQDTIFARGKSSRVSRICF